MFYPERNCAVRSQSRGWGSARAVSSSQISVLGLGQCQGSVQLWQTTAGNGTNPIPFPLLYPRRLLRICRCQRPSPSPGRHSRAPRESLAGEKGLSEQTAGQPELQALPLPWPPRGNVLLGKEGKASLCPSGCHRHCWDKDRAEGQAGTAPTAWEPFALSQQQHPSQGGDSSTDITWLWEYRESAPAAFASTCRGWDASESQEAAVGLVLRGED